MSSISRLESRLIAFAEASDDPASLCNWVEYYPALGRVAGHWRAKSAVLRLVADLAPSVAVLNALREALDCADFSSTRINDLDVEGAKSWVLSAMEAA